MIDHETYEDYDRQQNKVKEPVVVYVEAHEIPLRESHRNQDPKREEQSGDG
jgi:hypothetical protein